MLQGFENEVEQSQIIFRNLLHSMSHPGTIMEASIASDIPKGLYTATGAILLTLLDYETPFWIDSKEYEIEASDWIRFHTGAERTFIKQSALFPIFLSSKGIKENRLKEFSFGTSESPHKSATMIIQTDGISNDKDIKLTGPGIKDEIFVSIDTDKEFFKLRENYVFPLGIDMIFVFRDKFLAVPRTTNMEIL